MAVRTQKMSLLPGVGWRLTEFATIASVRWPQVYHVARRGTTLRQRRRRAVGRRAEYRDTHPSSVATCAASTVSNRPTVVMGERPGGSSRRRYAIQRSPSRVTVPRIFVAQAPDQQTRAGAPGGGSDGAGER